MLKGKKLNKTTDVPEEPIKEFELFYYDLELDEKYVNVKEELWLNEEFQVQSHAPNFENIREQMITHLKRFYNAKERSKLKKFRAIFDLKTIQTIRAKNKMKTIKSLRDI